jgi:hypothetical protein
MNKDPLIQKIAERNKTAIQTVYRALELFPWEDQNAYGNWLAQSYYYVSHTTRLLALAAARMPFTHNQFHSRFVSHLAEEKGHEKLCVKDLKALGLQPSDFPELPQTSALYHSVYYLIEHADPCAILGYAMVLEGISATKASDLLNKLTALYGKSATSFLSLHVEADKEHTEENRSVLEVCSQEQLAVILREIEMIESEYRSMLAGIQEHLRGGHRDSRNELPRMPFKKAA